MAPLSEHTPRAWAVPTIWSAPSDLESDDGGEVEERSARLASAEVRGPPLDLLHPLPAPIGCEALLDRLVGELDTLGGACTRFLRRTLTHAPHQPTFTALNVVVCTSLLLWMFEPFQGIWSKIPPITLFVWGGRADARVLAQGEVWRFFTSLLLHSSLLHWLTNLFALIPLDILLERRHGALVLLAVYVLSGVGGNIWSATFEQCEVVVGASGAILGITAATAVDVCHGHRSMRLLTTRACFVLGALVGITTAAARGSVGTSHWSHLGGSLCGLASAQLLLPLLTPHTVRMPPMQLAPPQCAAPRFVLRMTLSCAAAAVMILTFCILPINLMGMLPAEASFGGQQPKMCARTCTGWCACDWGAADVGAPCLMANRAFGGAGGSSSGDDLLLALRG